MVRVIGMFSCVVLLVTVSGVRAGVITGEIDLADRNGIEQGKLLAAGAGGSIAERLSVRPLDAALSIDAVSLFDVPTSAPVPASSTIGNVAGLRDGDQSESSTNTVEVAPEGEVIAEVVIVPDFVPSYQVLSSGVGFVMSKSTVPEPPIFAMLGTVLVGLFFRTRILRHREASLALAQ